MLARQMLGSRGSVMAAGGHRILQGCGWCRHWKRLFLGRQHKSREKGKKALLRSEGSHKYQQSWRSSVGAPEGTAMQCRKPMLL